MKILLRKIGIILIIFWIISMAVFVVVCSAFEQWSLLAKFLIPTLFGWFIAESEIIDALKYKWHKVFMARK
jgi:hypothetical protein